MAGHARAPGTLLLAPGGAALVVPRVVPDAGDTGALLTLESAALSPTGFTRMPSLPR